MIFYAYTFQMSTQIKSHIDTENDNIRPLKIISFQQTFEICKYKISILSIFQTQEKLTHSNKKYAHVTALIMRVTKTTGISNEKC